jgi:hypothetical protein
MLTSSISVEIALATANECSTLYRWFELTGMLPIVLPDLFLILLDFFANSAE